MLFVSGNHESLNLSMGRLVHLQYLIFTMPVERAYHFSKVISGCALLPGKELRNTACVKHDMNKNGLIDKFDTVKDSFKRGSTRRGKR